MADTPSRTRQIRHGQGRALLLGAFLLLLPALFVAQLVLHLVVQAQVSSQLGFGYGTPYKEGEEVFVISAVEPGKPMHDAGVRRGDYVRFSSVDSLYHLLVYNQGKTVNLPLQRGQQVLDLKLTVPPLHLSVPPRCLLWLTRGGDKVYRNPQ